MFDGLEIDLLSLGNADCILATQWHGCQAVRVLIDGGRKSDYDVIRTFLRALNITYIDHLVSTHPHDDHIAGLVELVEDRTLMFGHAWVHMPRFHVDMGAVDRALTKTAALREARRIRESLRMSSDLLVALGRRSIVVDEPFAGGRIGFFTICGPSIAFYEELLSFFANAEAIDDVERRTVEQETADIKLNRLTLMSALCKMSESLSDNPRTSPENESSVILGTTYNYHKYILTADAGSRGLTHAIATYDLSNCNWMQLPHHGSRRNLTPSLINYFRPTYAYVSACGDSKHPRRAVVNALKNVGSQVFSTHYPNAHHLRHFHGSVPIRLDYGSAFPLWDAPQTPKPAVQPDYVSLMARGLGLRSSGQ